MTYTPAFQFIYYVRKAEKLFKISGKISSHRELKFGGVNNVSPNCEKSLST